MSYNSKVVGLVISRLRNNRGLSQNQLAAMTGISRSHLAVLQSGRKNARLDTFCSIAEALGLRASDLMAMVEEEIGSG